MIEDLSKEYENVVMKKIQEDPNYKLIKDISSTLIELENYDLCTHIKQKFKVSDLDEYDIHLILHSKDGAKYLYDFCDEIRNEQQVQYLQSISVLDNEKINAIEYKILPKLKKVIREQYNVALPKVREREQDER